jgi:hypothetical protein
MTKAHDAKDGWSAITNDPSWPGGPKAAPPQTDDGVWMRERAGLCPKIPEEIPSNRLPAFAGGDSNRTQAQIERALDRLTARVEVLERQRLGTWTPPTCR